MGKRRPGAPQETPMAKPPETPPSSDIDGVNEDRSRIDTPENARDPGGKLRREEDDAAGRPEPSRA